MEINPMPTHSAYDQISNFYFVSVHSKKHKFASKITLKITGTTYLQPNSLKHISNFISIFLCVDLDRTIFRMVVLDQLKSMEVQTGPRITICSCVINNMDL